MAHKREQVIRFIEKLVVGKKVSVRGLSHQLGLSEGTVYQGIKEAEERGLVATIPRVGTIRINHTIQTMQDTLTYQALLQIINGQVLAGEQGLTKVLHHFLIGAMTADRMLPYLTANALVIVGNREDVQQTALHNGAAVLITGGLAVSPAIVDLANRKELPILSTKFDTYTVATMINRALADQRIKHKIATVADVYTALEHTRYLYSRQTVVDYKRLNRVSTHARFPVITQTNQLVGIIAGKDIFDKAGSLTLDKVMTKAPVTVSLTTSLASVRHMMVYDGYELLPVVDAQLHLLGIISRQDVMAKMDERKEKAAGTYFDQVTSSLTAQQGGAAYHTTVLPQMTNQIGTISFGVLSELVASACQRHLHYKINRASTIDQVSLHYLRLIQLDARLTIIPLIMEAGRHSAKIDVNVQQNNQLVAKAIVTCQLLENPK
ncbi:DRTGG domain-containing protein [Loigolactobacillus backii]|uniref:Uncharacterized protein n=1 Tax=Loigolactobacillus backii TaxID=375175 RepID=A0A192H2M4_9LACO|nr:DRTGG domain-containing protein [Loigolactobacillus backii]ANK62610.1 hypothetical protein AYR53_07385 [Loigolactobacillus backii]ANK70380.1 hypothetical protein AYR56_09615 [Loigolactobacillus backii]MDA5388045.1 DRTGG domain-containing protein [Loigolactobacillus backii]MDA5390508.1 DRTGG domain-containing protein [Loigolactobacillus backii]